MLILAVVLAVAGLVMYYFYTKSSPKSAYSRSDVIREWTEASTAVDHLLPMIDNGKIDKKVIKKELTQFIDRYWRVVDARYVDFSEAGDLKTLSRAMSMPKNAEIWDVLVVMFGLKLSIRSVYYPGFFAGGKPPSKWKQWEKKLGGTEPVGCSNYERSKKVMFQPPGSFHCDDCLMEVMMDEAGAPNASNSCQEYLFNTIREPMKYALDRFIKVHSKGESFKMLEIAKGIQESGLLDKSYSEIVTVGAESFGVNSDWKKRGLILKKDRSLVGKKAV